jgi:hypothetical protein
MKAVFLCLLLLINLFPLGNAVAEDNTTTVMVYLCGSDLQEDACEDLMEMAEVEAGDTINLVVLAGGAGTWDIEDLKGGSRTLAVIRDGYYEVLEDWGPGSMGSPDCLEDFLRYGLTTYPADRTMAILWDHGAGSEGGICFDETADDDSLTVSEIHDALAALQASVPDFHLSIFGCDACMMATYEMASMLSSFNIDYYVASEELEPGTGWYYTDWMNLLKSSSDAADEDLCREIVDSYMEKALQENPEDCLTLSAVDLALIRDLKPCMELFAAVITNQVEGGNLSLVRRGRSRMYTFGSFVDASWDMVDLGAMLDTYAQFDPGLAAEARSVLNRAVICSAQTDNLDTCSGLSILLPQDTAESFDEYRDGLNLSEIIPNWISFVSSYAGMLNTGHYQITASQPSPVSDGEELEGLFTPSSFFSSLYWSDETEGYIEPEEEEISIDMDGQGFTATLSPGDLDYLDYVEGMLMMDISDEEISGYVDFGTMRNNLLDWNTGTVLSLYDGTWPVFGDQPVPLYDQTSNGHSRRSLIPVKLNGEYTYLVVVFPADGTEGRILGANSGYDENGLPVRSVSKLNPGDEIIPVYTFFYEEEGKEELQESEFDGSPIIWQEGMTVTYEDLSDEGDPVEMYFCFIFNDIFGDYTMSELMPFEI